VAGDGELELDPMGKARVGCRHDLEPLEEVLTDRGTVKRSSGEESHGAEQTGAATRRLS
jgi:hypothetical protein